MRKFLIEALRAAPYGAALETRLAAAHAGDLEPRRAQDVPPSSSRARGSSATAAAVELTSRAEQAEADMLSRSAGGERLPRDRQGHGQATQRADRAAQQPSSDSILSRLQTVLRGSPSKSSVGSSPGSRGRLQAARRAVSRGAPRAAAANDSKDGQSPPLPARRAKSVSRPLQRAGRGTPTSPDERVRARARQWLMQDSTAVASELRSPEDGAGQTPAAALATPSPRPGATARDLLASAAASPGSDYSSHVQSRLERMLAQADSPERDEAESAIDAILARVRRSLKADGSP